MIIRAHSVRVLVSWIAVVVVILAGRVVGMAAVAVGSPGVCGGGHGQEEDAEEDRNEFFHGDTNFRNGEIEVLADATRYPRADGGDQP